MFNSPLLSIQPSISTGSLIGSSVKASVLLKLFKDRFYLQAIDAPDRFLAGAIEYSLINVPNNKVAAVYSLVASNWVSINYKVNHAANSIVLTEIAATDILVLPTSNLEFFILHNKEIIKPLYPQAQPGYRYSQIVISAAGLLFSLTKTGPWVAELSSSSLPLVFYAKADKDTVSGPGIDLLITAEVARL